MSTSTRLRPLGRLRVVVLVFLDESLCMVSQMSSCQHNPLPSPARLPLPQAKLDKSRHGMLAAANGQDDGATGQAADADTDGAAAGSSAPAATDSGRSEAADREGAGGGASGKGGKSEKGSGRDVTLLQRDLGNDDMGLIDWDD